MIVDNKRILVKCAYCGSMSCRAGSLRPDMCTECQYIYSKYKVHKRKITNNGLIIPDTGFLEYQDYYLNQRELGFKVPMDFRKDGKNETM